MAMKGRRGEEESGIKSRDQGEKGSLEIGLGGREFADAASEGRRDVKGTSRFGLSADKAWPQSGTQLG